MQPSSTAPNRPEPGPHPRVVVMGDSVIAGYGVGGRSYATLIGGRLHASRSMSYARSTFTTLDALRLMDRVERFEPDLALVNVGGSDGLVHAGRTVERLLERFAPKSWQGIEGLEPKPHRRAATRVAHVRQVITGAMKLAVKHIGVRLTGGFRRVPPAEFEIAFAELMQRLSRLGCIVVVIGVHKPDERLWPRSTASGLEYEAATRRVLVDYRDVLFFDPKPLLHCWDDFLSDHAHFNEEGHAKVAELILGGLAHHGVSQAPPTDQPTGRSD